jgi:hypothetical protein
MDIPDVAVLKSLLDTLRDSPAWQEAQTRTAEPQLTGQPTQTVASLLSQLQQQPSGCPDNGPTPDPSSLTDSLAPSPHVRPPDACDLPQAAVATSIITRERATDPDVASLTFQQALPLLAELISDEDIIAQLTTVCLPLSSHTTSPPVQFISYFLRQIKNDQDDLEQKLYQEYQAIHKKYQDKLQVAQTKPVIAATTPSRVGVIIT